MKPITICVILAIIFDALYTFFLYSLASVGFVITILFIPFFALFFMIFASLVLVIKKKDKISICTFIMSLSELIFITSLIVIFIVKEFNPIILTISTFSSFSAMWASVFWAKILEK